MNDPLEELFASARPTLPAGAVQRVLATWKDPALAAEYFWRDVGDLARRAFVPCGALAACALLALGLSLRDPPVPATPAPFDLESSFAQVAWPFVGGV